MEPTRRITTPETFQRIGASACFAVASVVLYFVATQLEPPGVTVVRVGVYLASGFCVICAALGAINWVQFLMGRRTLAGDSAIWAGALVAVTLPVACVIAWRGRSDVVKGFQQGMATGMQTLVAWSCRSQVFALLMVSTSGVRGIIIVMVATQVYALIAG
jgi:hypothetical protein